MTNRKSDTFISRLAESTVTESTTLIGNAP